MTVAVSKAVEEGARRSSAPPPATPRPRRPPTPPGPASPARCSIPRGQDRARQARPGAGPRRPGAPGRAATSTTAWRWSGSSPSTTRWRWSTRSTRYRLAGPEDGRLRDRRGARRRPRRPLPAGRQRRQHHRLLDGLHRGGRQRRRGCSASRPPARRRSSPGSRWSAAGHHRHRHPDRPPGLWPRALGAPRRVRRHHRRGHRPRDPGRLPAAGPRGGRVRASSASAATVAGLLQPTPAWIEAGQRSSAPSPATASRTPTGPWPEPRPRPGSPPTPRPPPPPSNSPDRPGESQGRSTSCMLQAIVAPWPGADEDPDPTRHHRTGAGGVAADGGPAAPVAAA